LYDVAGSDKY
nr:Chain D, HRAS-like suppressor 3 [Homo sapiens]